MISQELLNIITNLSQIEEDQSVPKNIRAKIKNAVIALKQDTISIEIKKNKALQELDNLDDDPNIPMYTRTQIWNIVSLLESIQ
jgi:uncharacterized protein (UPF0147 family)